MKNILAILACLLLTIITVNGQIGFQHTLRPRQLARGKYQLYIKTDSGERVYPLTGTLKGYATAKDDAVIFEVESYVPDNQANDEIQKLPFRQRVELRNSRKHFADRAPALTIPFHSISINVLAAPVRYRFSTSTVSGARMAGGICGSPNFGLSIGYTTGASRFSMGRETSYALTVGPLLAVGVAELKKESVVAPESWTNNLTLPSLSYGVSAIFSRNAVGLMVSFGWDKAMGNSAGQWIYNNKPWIGVGISTTIVR
jgi:hypothetical protein